MLLNICDTGDAIITNVGDLKGSWKKRIAVKKQIKKQIKKQVAEEKPLKRKADEIQQSNKKLKDAPVETYKVSKLFGPEEEKGIETTRDDEKYQIGDQKSTTEQEEKENKKYVAAYKDLFSKDINDFSELGINTFISKHIENTMKVVKPTKIQSLAIPAILDSKNENVFIRSFTGSGKTLAFLLPLITKYFNAPKRSGRQDGIHTIVISPTKELATQTYQVTLKVLNGLKDEENKVSVVSGLLNGNDKRKSEKARIRKGMNIVVCTIGRIIDHLENTSCFDVSAIKNIVFDEADRLLDFGFEPKIQKILDLISEKKKDKDIQMIMCSATVSGTVDTFASKIMKKYIVIDGQVDQSIFETPEALAQSYIQCTPKLRLVTLFAVIKWKLEMAKNAKMIVFVSCCKSVDFHYQLFNTLFESRLNDVKVFRLHGNLDQCERNESLGAFTKSQKGIIFCTDVAARGLDLPVVKFVVQYDPPSDCRDYIHRAGRTARLGKAGESLLFLMPNEIEYVDMLNEKGCKLSSLDAEVILPFLANDQPYQDAASELQFEFEKIVESQLVNSARDAYLSSVKAYGSHRPEEKHIFEIRKVHIGHWAKAFGLRESPSEISKNSKLKNGIKDGDEYKSKSLFRTGRSRPDKKSQVLNKAMNLMKVSQEFSSGI